MSPIYGLAQEPAATPAPASKPSIQEIPFDYVAKFALTGVWGNRLQQTINISTEGAFIAGEIGYSFLPSYKTLQGLLPPASSNATSGTEATSTVFLDYLWEMLGSLVTADQDNSAFSNIALTHRPVLRWFATRLVGVDFLYSIVDTATGRELQNQALHSLAGLGEPTGQRPFRPFPKPMLFAPGSTIRVEIEEVSEGSLYSEASLYLVLHGYKDLAYASGR